MNKRIVGGFILLIVLLGIATVFLLKDKDTEPGTVYNPPSDEVIQKTRDDLAAQKAQETAKTPPQREKQSIGHRHADGTWHDEPHEPIAQPAPASKTYTGTLTYHKELLETNPVEALRRQTLERGHWSAEWMPPFPPDDFEAASVARNFYITFYYHSIGDIDNPVYLKSLARNSEFLHTLWDKYPADRQEFGARRNDLLRLTWSRLDKPPMDPLRFRSNFFPSTFDETLEYLRNQVKE